MKFLIIFLILISKTVVSREVGETEITTTQGIEVFQIEKYYLLKENVNIITDTFELSADLVKAYFGSDLYDITKIESSGNSKMKNTEGMNAKGEIINLSIAGEFIEVIGENSSLIYNEIEMFSDKNIQINNISGEFKIKGNNSELITKSIYIFANSIDGKYKAINGVNEIDELFVEDPIESNMKTSKINMYSKKGIYNKKDNIIELFENVKIIRGGEIVTGDYANVDTLTDSYKVSSNKSEKVKILIKQDNE
jgi:lipopolysaccharide export system protein LptA